MGDVENIVARIEAIVFDPQEALQAAADAASDAPEPTSSTSSSSPAKPQPTRSEKKDSLTLCHLNIRSLLAKKKKADLESKKEKLEKLLQNDLSCDILILTEHWNNVDNKNLITLTSYKLVESFCRTNVRGGGSCILRYDHENLDRENISTLRTLDLVACIAEPPPDLFKTRSQISLIAAKNFEVCAVKLSFRAENILIVGIYRSPNSDKMEYLRRFEILLENITSQNLKAVLMGDINIDTIVESPEKKSLTDILNCFRFRLSKPQERKNETGTMLSNELPNDDDVPNGSLIDHVYTNLPEECVKNIGFTIDRRISDHDAQLLTISRGIGENITDPGTGPANRVCVEHPDHLDDILLITHLLRDVVWPVLSALDKNEIVVLICCYLSSESNVNSETTASTINNLKKQGFSTFMYKDVLAAVVTAKKKTTTPTKNVQSPLPSTDQNTTATTYPDINTTPKNYAKKITKLRLSTDQNNTPEKSTNEISTPITSAKKISTPRTYMDKNENLDDRLAKVVKECNCETLDVNWNKTCYLNFTLKGTVPIRVQPLMIDLVNTNGDPFTVTLTQVQKTDLLGFHLDSSLKWDTHIDMICAKLGDLICELRTIARNASREVELCKKLGDSIYKLRTTAGNESHKVELYKKLGDSIDGLRTIAGNRSRKVELCKKLENSIDELRTIAGNKSRQMVLCKELGDSIDELRTIVRKESRKVVLSSYFDKFHSFCTYGLEIWGRAKESDRVYQMQKRAVDIIIGKEESSLANRKLKFKELEILPLPSELFYRVALFTHTHLDLLNRDPEMPRSYMITSKQFLTLYNRIPKWIRDADSIELFKNKLKKWLFEMLYYTFEEINELCTENFE